MLGIQFGVLAAAVLSLILLPVFLIIRKTRKWALVNLAVIGAYILMASLPVIPYYNSGFAFTVEDDEHTRLAGMEAAVIRCRYRLNTMYFLPLIDPVESSDNFVGKYSTDGKGELKVDGGVEFLRLFEMNRESYHIFTNIRHRDLLSLNIYELKKYPEVLFPNKEYAGNVLITTESLAADENRAQYYNKYFIQWIETAKLYQGYTLILKDAAAR